MSWHTAQPNASGSSEYRANGAARLPVGTLATSSDATGAAAENAAALTGAAATGAWTAITHIGIASALTGGTFQASDALGASVTLALGEKIRIPAGDLTVSFPTT